MIDRHHLVPKERLKKGVQKLPRNTIRIKRERHNAWHLLFGNKTLLEVIRLLGRIYRIKSREMK